MSNIKEAFDKLAPAIDDIIQKVSQFDGPIQARAALMSLVMTHISVPAQKTMIKALLWPDKMDDDAARVMSNIVFESMVSSAEEIERFQSTCTASGRMQ